MCATLQLLQFKFYPLLYGKKSCSNVAIILHSTCRIGDFCQFLPVSGRTTACKRDITWDRLQNLLIVMPCLRAVVCVCDFAIAAIQVLFTALACVAGWWNFIEFQCKKRAAIVPLSCGIGNFCQFYP